MTPPTPNQRFEEDFVIAFVMHCDESGLSEAQGENLAEQLGYQLNVAAADRRDYLPPELQDGGL